jgi:hypothetical protein
MRDTVDERRVAEWAHVDLVVAHIGHARPALVPLEELLLVDAATVGERADEVVAQVLAVPLGVGFDERADVVRIEGVQRRNRVGFRG